jgi:hypothetical protein
LLNCLANAQPTSEQKYIFNILYRQRADISQVAPSEDKATIDRIRITVPYDKNPALVGVDSESDPPIIVVGTGFCQMVRWIQGVTFMASIFNKQGIFEEYIEYQTLEIANGKTPISPIAFYHLSSDQLKVLEANDFYNTIEGFLIAQLAFVLAHEVAHVVLRHKSTIAISKIDSRKQEAQADKWATNICVKMGIPPSLAYPSLMLWYFYDKNGVATERMRTHPPELRRIRWIMAQSIKRADEWNANDAIFPSLQPQELAKFQTACKRLLAHVTHLISKQRDYPDEILNLQQFGLCMEALHEGCVKSCVNDYGHEQQFCEDTMCQTQRQLSTNKLRCAEYIEALLRKGVDLK